MNNHDKPHEPAKAAGVSETQAIQAVDFDVPGAPNTESYSAPQVSAASIPVGLATSKNAPWWHSQFNLMICVFGLLVIAALLFVGLAPPPNVDSITATNNSTQSEGDTPAPLEDAPFDEKRLTQARADSQEILSDLLVSKKALERQGVTEWAPKKFADALTKAEQGDEVYKQQNFPLAIQYYKNSLEQLNSLDDLIPQVIQSRLDAGFVAIKEGKSALAKESFNAALRLDQNSIDAFNGLERANTLDQVIELVRAGAVAEDSFKSSDKIDDLRVADKKYTEALAVDELTLSAQQGLARVSLASQDKRFRLSMTKGFNSLFAKRYSSAKLEFSKALKIKPGDGTANGAYKQALAADKSSSLSGLLATASGLEKAESWSSALSNYEIVLQRDPNQVSAKLGQIRSRVRSELDIKMTEVLKDPLALARGTQRERATKVLNDAKAISKKGPKLKSQINQIETALSGADISIKVTLFSDGVSDISLIKAGAKKIDLGTFTSKNMALKPGRYVLVGSRLGYQDVRRNVELTPSGNGVQSFTIRSDTPINKRQ